MTTTETGIVELLACPFCGGEAKPFMRIGSAVAIGCVQCGAQMGMSQQARSAWNTRAAMPDSTQLLQKMAGALEPFAALARPKTWPDALGETGPSKLDLIEGENGTGELYLGTHFGTEKYLTLWRHEFEDALTALAQFRAQEQRP